MPRGNEKFIRRQKEIARQQKAEEKRRQKAARKSGTGDGGTPDDDIAAIQAALDAGLNPGSQADRLGEAGASDEEPAEGEGSAE